MVTRTPLAQYRPPPTRIGPGTQVAINYILRTNGTIRHIRTNAWGDEPLEFVHGEGRLLPALERALEGKVVGDQITVTLPPEEAYGARDPDLQQRVPAAMFEGIENLDSGMCLVARSEDGRHVENVMITEIDQEQGTVLVDTNHPLAGMTLEFEISVVAVRHAPQHQAQQPAEGSRSFR